MSMLIKTGVKNYRLTLLAQSMLDFLGYEVSSLDGDFGPQTDNAVRQFQHEHDLAVDGIVGEKTWKALFAAVDASMEQGGNEEVVALKGMELGDLSAKWESRGKPDAIGKDKKGGFSYGTYQIATRTGTMGRFLWFLKEHARNVYDVLMAAGGEWGATQGSDAFQQAWKCLVKENTDNFPRLQRQFIAETHFQPLYRKLQGTPFQGVTVGFTLKNMLWSIGVQHGVAGGFSLIKNALNEYKVSEMSGKEIIIKVYEERSLVDKYFVGSPFNIRQSVLKRFATEREDALALWGQEQQSALTQGKQPVDAWEVVEA